MGQVGNAKTIKWTSGKSIISLNMTQDSKHTFAKRRDYKMIKGITRGENTRGRKLSAPDNRAQGKEIRNNLNEHE